MRTITKSLTIGEAARRSGLTPKAIRLYEQRGLLAPADRTEAGYRTYSEPEVALLRFIRQAKALGLRLDEIREIIELQRGGGEPCEAVLAMVDAHLAAIEQALADLRALRGTLRRARQSATESRRRGKQTVVCRIIEAEPRTLR